MRLDIVDGRLAAWHDYSAREHMKAVPGARWDPKARAWTYPLSYPSAVSIGVLATKLRVPIAPSPEATTWVQEQTEDWQALTAAGLAVSADKGTEGFYPHQVQCANWLAMASPRGRLDTSETGSGKTRSALRAAWDCWSRGETGILLVATLVAVKAGWAEEVEAVAPLLPLPDGAAWQVFVVPNAGTMAKRAKVFESAQEASEAAGGVGVVLIVNHEQLRTHSRLSGYGDIALARCPACGGVREGEDVVSATKCHAHTKELNKLNYVAVVVDEAHRLMNPRAQTTRAGWSVCDSAPRVWGLTGTPGSRSVMENTWALLRLVNGKDWPSKSSWTAYFAHCGHNSLGIWEIGRLRAERADEFRVGYSGLTRRVLKAQVLNLPPLLRGGTLVHRIPMKGEQAKVYKEMESLLRFEVEEGEVTSANALAMVSRLCVLASGSGAPGPKYGQVERYDDEGNPVYNTKMEMRAPSNKVDYVVDMIAGDGLEPGTAFQAVHPDLLTMLRDALVKKKLIRTADEFGLIIGSASEAARTRARLDFQSGKIPFIGFTTGAGGTGITLTRASTMVALERPWSPIQWKQAQDRVHRIGSERHETVSIIDVITEDSVEDRQLVRFMENEDAMEDVLRDKERLAELLFGCVPSCSMVESVLLFRRERKETWLRP